MAENRDYSSRHDAWPVALAPGAAAMPAVVRGWIILISPDDRESFMEELARRCPHLA